jgi:hypothetical protein
MTADNLSPPHLRAEAVTALIGRAQAEDLGLAALAGFDLCVLGGPRQAAFPEAMTNAWAQLADEDRQSLTRSSTARLLAEGLLLHVPGGEDADYPVSPELGVILAARSQPAYLVVVQRQDSPLPGLSLFALGDNGRPVQAIVTEILVKAPPAGAGPLRCIYGYQLVSTASAASLLADWTIGKAEKARRWSREPARLVTRYFPADDRDRIGQRITVHGDGNTARVTGLDTSDPTAERLYSRSELEDAMAGFLAGDPP